MKLIYSFMLAIICATFIYNVKHSYHYRQISPYIKPVEGMTWGEGKNKLTAHVQSHKEPDYDIFLLSFNNEDNKTVFQQELTIDWDLLGVGVLQAMQVDDDPELEIVFRTNRVYPFDSERLAKIKSIKESVYFDIQQGKVEIKDINKLSEQAKELAVISLIH